MTKKQNLLKKYGMEKEFKQWMLDTKKTWSVGAPIEMTENLPGFNILKGDRGIILSRYLDSEDKPSSVSVQLGATSRGPEQKRFFYVSRMRLI